MKGKGRVNAKTVKKVEKVRKVTRETKEAGNPRDQTRPRMTKLDLDSEKYEKKIENIENPGRQVVGKNRDRQ